MKLVALSLVLAACSPKPAPAPATPPPIATAPVADTIAAPPSTDAAVAPAPDPTDVSQLEHGDVDGPGGLHLTVSWMTMTGTMHTAQDVVMTSPRGTLHLAGNDFAQDEHADGLHSTPLPLFDRALAAGAHRWVVLGWSSYGEGMQSEHAWLVEDGAGGPRIVDSLVWTTDRMHGGVALDPRKGVRVGVPLPDSEVLHSSSPWTLRHDAQVLMLADVRKMPTSATRVTALRDHYDPPDDGAPSTRHWAGRFVWFETSANGFVVRSS